MNNRHLQIRTLAAICLLAILLESCGAPGGTTAPSNQSTGGETPVEATAPPEEETKETETPSEQPVVGPTSPPIPTNPALEAETLEKANAYADLFITRYSIEVDAARAVGLDASNVNGEANVLASTAAPPASADQLYEGDLLVYGYLSVEVDQISQFTGLPPDGYLIACPEGKSECLAVPANGEKPINLKAEVTVFEEEVERPIAYYEKGSVRVCFRIRRVRVCATIF